MFTYLFFNGNPGGGEDDSCDMLSGVNLFIGNDTGLGSGDFLKGFKNGCF